MGKVILDERFEELIKKYTRREFNELFVASSKLCKKETWEDVIMCPFIIVDNPSRCPNSHKNCTNCWEDAIKMVKFKDEVEVPTLYVPKGLQDPYLNEDIVFERLVREYKEHNELIIAYDFDSTVSDPRNQGCTYDAVTNLLRKWKGKAKFICFTCRTPERYVGVMKYLIENDIPVDSINCGFEGVPNGTCKPYYNAFLDDRAGLCETYNVLNRVLNEISK